MAKFTVSDVMERKIDYKSVGHIIVIECKGDSGAMVSQSIFVESKDLPVPSKTSISTIAETWLKQKDGALTRAEGMAAKAVNISEEQVKTLIPTAELSVVVEKDFP